MRRPTGPPTRYFFDTSVLIRALEDRNSQAHSAVFSKDPLSHRYTSWTVIKELRRMPRDHPELGFASHDIERFVIELLEHLIVVPAANKEAFLGIKIRDRSDRPLVAEARRVAAILVTADHHLAEDGKEYVETLLFEG